MATTKNNQIGRIRTKLATLLKSTIPGLEIDPIDINSQVPMYASAIFDCCSWYAVGKRNGMDVNISSWNTMTECVRRGISIVVDDTVTIEVTA